MPTLPAISPTTGQYTSVGIMQAIIDKVPELDGVPMPTATTESIRMVGQEITRYASRRNSFCNALINLIGMQRIHYMLFTNPLAWAKQGKLEMGETVEQIWLGLAEAFPFDPVKAESTFAKRRQPDISSAFHSINYAETYVITVDYDRLKRAFLSLEGLEAFVEEIIGMVVRAVTVDEFLMTKYLIDVMLLEGIMKTQAIPALTKETADDAITIVKETTNNFQFPSNAYTIAGNENTCSPEDTYVLQSSRANALINVNVLASAFNVDYVKFMGHVAMIDSLANIDWKRMDMLMGYNASTQTSPYDPSYRHFTDAEIASLKTVEMIVMDKRFLQIYDNLDQMETPFINGEGGYTNYPYQVSKIFSASPFHNCVAYTTVESSVTTITVSAGNDTVKIGTQVGLTADVTTTGFANAAVTWSIPETEGVYMGQDGILYVSKNASAGTVTVTATSVADPTVTGTLDITIEA